MDALARTAPPPGSAQAGDLYVDLQTRTLWLGVDMAVDPTTFVLISDIVALQDEIEGSLVEAKAYTDTKTATRAPTVHTHTSSQITDFTAAVTSVALSLPQLNWVRGMILQWSGSLAEIGVGGLAGWSLCDGSNSTPDLRDKFVLAAGSRAVGATNNASFTTDAGGGHDHSVAGTAISVAQMPAHGHGCGIDSPDHTHILNHDTGGESAEHTHTYGWSGGGGGSTNAGGVGAQSGLLATSGRSAGHFHHIDGSTSGRQQTHTHAITNTGSDQAHTHVTVGGGGIHTHVITAIQLREAIPFYALAYIMKL